MQNIIPKYNPTKRQQLLEKYKKNIHSNTVERWENHESQIFELIFILAPKSVKVDLSQNLIQRGRFSPKS